jgi:uncharacterized coiled-coil DUF342 family protein
MSGGDTEFLKKTDELRKKINASHELGEDWRENTAIVNDAFGGYGAVLRSIEHLCNTSSQGSMVKIGLTLIAFPVPIIIDDVLGWSFLAAGLIQRKIKNSALHLEDIENTFPRLLKELQETRQEIVQLRAMVKPFH